MKKAIKHLSALMMALVMTLGLFTTAFAADDVPTVTFAKEGMSFTNISTDYTETDLFNGFKGTMPGDVLDQPIILKNDYKQSDFLNVYMYVQPHYDREETSEENPESSKKNLPESMDKFPDNETTIAQMNEFLSHLNLKVWNSKDKAGTPFFDATAEGDGGLTEAKPAYLGKINQGAQIDLTAELNVPMELENDYQKFVGEVDWVFYAVAGNNPHNPDHPDNPDYPYYPDTPDGPDNPTYQYKSLKLKKVWDDNGNEHPDRIKVNVYDDGKLKDTVYISEKNNWKYTIRGLDKNSEWTVEEVPVKGYEATYKTTGNTVTITNTSTDTEQTPATKPGGNLIQTGQLNWPIPVLLVLGLILIILGVIFIRKKKNSRA